MAWTKVTKATGTSWTAITEPSNAAPPMGSPIGLLLALTYATSTATNWNKISKATGTSWTTISKAT